MVSCYTRPVASVAWIEKEKTPGSRAIPETVPFAPSDVPGGSDPLATANAYGGNPPLAANDAV